MVCSHQFHLFLLLFSVPVVYSQCSQSASCNFENGFCGFSDGNTGVSTNKWMAINSMFLIPAHDGKFAYPFRGTKSPGANVDMTSPSLCSGQLLCVSFDYVIKYVTTLQVLMQCDVGQNETTLPVYRTITSTWQTANINVTACTDSPAKVVFRGSASTDHRLAMDNIDIRPCSADLTTLKTLSTTPEPLTTTPKSKTTTPRPTTTTPRTTTTIPRTTTTAPRATSATPTSITTTPRPTTTTLKPTTTIKRPTAATSNLEICRQDSQVRYVSAGHQCPAC